MSVCKFELLTLTSSYYICNKELNLNLYSPHYNMKKTGLSRNAFPDKTITKTLQTFINLR